MTRLLMSTPVSDWKTSEVKSLIPLSLSSSVLTTPSQIPKKTKSVLKPRVDSPEVLTKRKLSYAEDPSFHVSECEMPQKSDLSIYESVEEIQQEETLPHPLNLVKENKNIVFKNSLN